MGNSLKNRGRKNGARSLKGDNAKEHSLFPTISRGMKISLSNLRPDTPTEEANEKGMCFGQGLTIPSFNCSRYMVYSPVSLFHSISVCHFD